MQKQQESLKDINSIELYKCKEDILYFTDYLRKVKFSKTDLESINNELNENKFLNLEDTKYSQDSDSAKLVYVLHNLLLNPEMKMMCLVVKSPSIGKMIIQNLTNLINTLPDFLKEDVKLQKMSLTKEFKDINSNTITQNKLKYFVNDIRGISPDLVIVNNIEFLQNTNEKIKENILASVHISDVSKKSNMNNRTNTLTRIKNYFKDMFVFNSNS